MPENTLFTYRVSIPSGQIFPDTSSWDEGEPAVIDRYWNGVSALREKGYNWKNLTELDSLWDSEFIYFRFHCWYETLQPEAEQSKGKPVEDSPDVLIFYFRLPGCEDYFEITLSPEGVWRDLHIRVPHLRVDPEWHSGISLDFRIDERERIWKGVLRLPYCELAVDGGTAPDPNNGDVWRVSFGRIVNTELEAEYLSWRPTFTPRPDFHVPHSFGNLIFMEG